MKKIIVKYRQKDCTFYVDEPVNYSDHDDKWIEDRIINYVLMDCDDEFRKSEFYITGIVVPSSDDIGFLRVSLLNHAAIDPNMIKKDDEIPSKIDRVSIEKEPKLPFEKKISAFASYENHYKKIFFKSGQIPLEEMHIPLPQQQETGGVFKNPELQDLQTILADSTVELDRVLKALNPQLDAALDINEDQVKKLKEHVEKFKEYDNSLHDKILNFVAGRKILKEQINNAREGAESLLTSSANEIIQLSDDVSKKQLSEFDIRNEVVYFKQLLIYASFQAFYNYATQLLKNSKDRRVTLKNINDKFSPYFQVSNAGQITFGYSGKARPFQNVMNNLSSQPLVTLLDFVHSVMEDESGVLLIGEQIKKQPLLEANISFGKNALVFSEKIVSDAKQIEGKSENDNGDFIKAKDNLNKLKEKINSLSQKMTSLERQNPQLQKYKKFIEIEQHYTRILEQENKKIEFNNDVLDLEIEKKLREVHQALSAKETRHVEKLAANKKRFEEGLKYAPDSGNDAQTSKKKRKKPIRVIVEVVATSSTIPIPIASPESELETEESLPPSSGSDSPNSDSQSQGVSDELAQGFDKEQESSNKEQEKIRRSKKKSKRKGKVQTSVDAYAAFNQAYDEYNTTHDMFGKIDSLMKDEVLKERLQYEADVLNGIGPWHDAIEKIIKAGLDNTAFNTAFSELATLSENWQKFEEYKKQFGDLDKSEIITRHRVHEKNSFGKNGLLNKTIKHILTSFSAFSSNRDMTKTELLFKDIDRYTNRLKEINTNLKNLETDYNEERLSDLYSILKKNYGMLNELEVNISNSETDKFISTMGEDLQEKIKVSKTYEDMKAQQKKILDDISRKKKNITLIPNISLSGKRREVINNLEKRMRRFKTEVNKTFKAGDERYKSLFIKAHDTVEKIGLILSNAITRAKQLLTLTDHIPDADKTASTDEATFRDDREKELFSKIKSCESEIIRLRSDTEANLKKCEKLKRDNLENAQNYLDEKTDHEEAIKQANNLDLATLESQKELPKTLQYYDFCCDAYHIDILCSQSLQAANDALALEIPSLSGEKESSAGVLFAKLSALTLEIEALKAKTDKLRNQNYSDINSSTADNSLINQYEIEARDFLEEMKSKKSEFEIVLENYKGENERAALFSELDKLKREFSAAGLNMDEFLEIASSFSTQLDQTLSAINSDDWTEEALLQTINSMRERLHTVSQEIFKNNKEIEALTTQYDLITKEINAIDLNASNSNLKERICAITIMVKEFGNAINEQTDKINTASDECRLVENVLNNYRIDQAADTAVEGSPVVVKVQPAARPPEVKPAAVPPVANRQRASSLGADNPPAVPPINNSPAVPPIKNQPVLLPPPPNVVRQPLAQQPMEPLVDQLRKRRREILKKPVAVAEKKGFFQRYGEYIAKMTTTWMGAGTVLGTILGGPIGAGVGFAVGTLLGFAVGLGSAAYVNYTEEKKNIERTRVEKEKVLPVPEAAAPQAKTTPPQAKTDPIKIPKKDHESTLPGSVSKKEEQAIAKSNSHNSRRDSIKYPRTPGTGEGSISTSSHSLHGNPRNLPPEDNQPSPQSPVVDKDANGKTPKSTI